MSSTILARKLASVKLSKREFEKIRSQKLNIMDKSFKVISQLKKIIDSQGINKVCRLCLKPGTKCIFEDEKDFNFVHNIQLILGIEVNKNDGKPQHICKTCESTLRDAQRLKQTAETTQWRLQQELDIVSGASSDLDVEESIPPNSGSFIEKEGKIKRQWSCLKCKKTFDVRAEFIEHEKQPTCRQPNSFICETCGKNLQTMTRLKRHRITHTGELRHACAVCPYRTRTAHALAVHSRVHTGARPLVCTHCAATFSSTSNLASHRRTHLPPAFRCQHCHKSFRFQQVLKNHMDSQHSTAKPHVCDTCGKAFATRKMICRHERRVHNRPKKRPGMVPTYLRQQEEAATRSCQDNT